MAITGASGSADGEAGGQGVSVEELTPSRIDAMIRLLADDDDKIRRVMRRHLIDVFETVEPYLIQRSEGDDDPRVREAAGAFLTDVRRRRRLTQWEAWVRDSYPDSFDLETGAFLIAAIEYPGIDIDAYRKRLDECAVVLSRRLGPPRGPGGRDPEAVVGKLNHLLFRELRLQGNREGYYDPDNSYIHRVLDRKLGIPISLSVIAMLVASRVGVELEGIGLPGHFLLRYRARHGRDVYIDPYNGGRVWTLQDCFEFLRGQGHDARDELFLAVSVREILIRMLGNLVHIYEQRGDDERQRRVTRLLEGLR